MSESKFQLGQLVPEPNGEWRDAVHVAVLAVEAGEDLLPGDRIRVDSGRAHAVLYGETATAIVDPFLPRQTLRPGQRFLACLLPGTVTGMRHVPRTCAARPSSRASAAAGRPGTRASTTGLEVTR